MILKLRGWGCLVVLVELEVVMVVEVEVPSPPAASPAVAAPHDLGTARVSETLAVKLPWCRRRTILELHATH